MNYRFIVTSILALICAIFWSFSWVEWFTGDNIKSIGQNDVIISHFIPINTTSEIIEKYINSKQRNEDFWMTFMSILSTVFAVFFVWTGFKIEDTRIQVENASRKMQESYEYPTQLQYAMSFIIQKQWEKAIDALEILRKELFVFRDSNKRNTCWFFLAHCFYEKGCISSNAEDLAQAVNYINDAIEAPDHPFKIEIINKFNQVRNSQTNS